MWPPAYYTGSPYSGSPMSDFSPMQQYQQQAAMQGMSRQQQVPPSSMQPLMRGLGPLAAPREVSIHSQSCNTIFC